MFSIVWYPYYVVRRASGRPAPVSTLRALKAWNDLEDAFAAYDRSLEAKHGVTRAQLELLHVIADRQPVTLSELRGLLGEHPATLGQMVDRVASRGWLLVVRDPGDRRRRLVELTDSGTRLLAAVPYAGPGRLRAGRISAKRLDALSDALHETITVFGLTRWLPKASRPPSLRPQ